MGISHVVLTQVNVATLSSIKKPPSWQRSIFGSLSQLSRNFLMD